MEYYYPDRIPLEPKPFITRFRPYIKADGTESLYYRQWQVLYYGKWYFLATFKGQKPSKAKMDEAYRRFDLNTGRLKFDNNGDYQRFGFSELILPE